jgi:hypothetical protein
VSCSNLMDTRHGDVEVLPVGREPHAGEPPHTRLQRNMVQGPPGHARPQHGGHSARHQVHAPHAVVVLRMQKARHAPQGGPPRHLIKWGAEADRVGDVEETPRRLHLAHGAESRQQGVRAVQPARGVRLAPLLTVGVARVS